MTQLTYNLYMDVGQPGLIYDLENARIVDSCAEGVITLGRAVVPGTDAEKQVKVPSAPSQVFRGIAALTHALEQNASGDGEYKDKSAVNVLKQGTVWVEVNGNVVVDEPAYFVRGGMAADIGKFRADNTDADAVPTGVFRSTANSGDLAQLEINLP